MIAIPAGVRIYLAMGPTDMRKGFDGLSMLAQEVLTRLENYGEQARDERHRLVTFAPPETYRLFRASRDT